MVDIAIITVAYEGLKVGKEILQSVLDMKVTAEAKKRVDEVMSKFGEAQDTLFIMREELFRLQSDNEELKKQILQSDNWSSKISEYELIQTSGGAIVHESKGEPKHYICPSCVAKEEIQPLQDNRNNTGSYRCVACSALFPINPYEEMDLLSFEPSY